MTTPTPIPATVAVTQDFIDDVAALVRAQSRMLNQWAEADEAVRSRLWKDLHERGRCLNQHPLIVNPHKATIAGAFT